MLQTLMHILNFVTVNVLHCSKVKPLHTRLFAGLGLHHLDPLLLPLKLRHARLGPLLVNTEVIQSDFLSHRSMPCFEGEAWHLRIITTTHGVYILPGIQGQTVLFIRGNKHNVQRPLFKNNGPDPTGLTEAKLKLLSMGVLSE